MKRFFLIFSFSVLPSLGSCNLRCYSQSEVARKLKSDSNILKYLKKACPKISKSDMEGLFGTRTMKLKEEGCVHTFLYLDRKFEFSQIEFLNLEANLALAKKINKEVCIKEKIPEDSHRFFNFMTDCRVISKKIAVVSRYFPEHEGFPSFIKNNFPSLYSYQMDPHYRAIMDQLLFDLANAVNILHNHGMVLNDISFENIGLSNSRNALFMSLEQVTLEDEEWQPLPGDSIYEDPALSAKMGNGFSSDMYRLGIVFFRMLNGIKAEEYLREYLKGEYIFMDGSEDMILRFPEAFSWMKNLFEGPSTRLCSNQIVRGIAQSISVKVIFEDFQGYEEPDFNKKGKSRRKPTLKQKQKMNKLEGTQTRKKKDLVIVEDHLNPQSTVNKMEVTQNMMDMAEPERIFKVNEPNTFNDSLYYYKMGSLELNYAASGSKMMFLI